MTRPQSESCHVFPAPTRLPAYVTQYAPGVREFTHP
jgi:hypothetical protein